LLTAPKDAEFYKQQSDTSQTRRFSRIQELQSKTATLAPGRVVWGRDNVQLS
jgi:hypothetical protein